jgi:hypothetical protein
MLNGLAIKLIQWLASIRMVAVDLTFEAAERIFTVLS